MAQVVLEVNNDMFLECLNLTVYFTFNRLFYIEKNYAVQTDIELTENDELLTEMIQQLEDEFLN